MTETLDKIPSTYHNLHFHVPLNDKELNIHVLVCVSEYSNWKNNIGISPYILDCEARQGRP
ncbi:unnamed protein product, partial [Rotaria socialis]